MLNINNLCLNCHNIILNWLSYMYRIEKLGHFSVSMIWSYHIIMVFPQKRTTPNKLNIWRMWVRYIMISLHNKMSGTIWAFFVCFLFIYILNWLLCLIEIYSFQCYWRIEYYIGVLKIIIKAVYIAAYCQPDGSRRVRLVSVFHCSNKLIIVRLPEIGQNDEALLKPRQIGLERSSVTFANNLLPSYWFYQ